MIGEYILQNQPLGWAGCIGAADKLQFTVCFEIPKNRVHKVGVQNVALGHIQFAIIHFYVRLFHGKVMLIIAFKPL